MCQAQNRHVQIVLIAEVVVHRSDIRSGLLTDLPDGRSSVPVLGKDFTGGVEQTVFSF